GLVLLAVAVNLIEDEHATAAYRIAVGMTMAGALVFTYAFFRSTIPTLLHDWREPVPGYALPLAILGALFLVLGLAARFALPGALNVKPDTDEARQLTRWSNIAVLTGIILCVAGLVRLFATDVLRSAGWATKVPEPYLLPNGIIQMLSGLFFILV